MGKIAILERTPHQQELENTLGLGGYDLSFYISRETLIQAIKTDPTIDLLLANITLLMGSGISNIKEVKNAAQLRQIPLLVIAPPNSQSLKILALKEGADDFMQKPLSPPELMARIGNLIRRKKEIEKLVEEKLHFQELAERDPHTLLPNRTYLLNRLAQEVSRVERHQEQLSIIMLQVDDFHLINARYGYEMGEEILTKISRLIRNNLRKEDILGRFGGKELLLLMPKTNSEGAMSTMKKLRKKVENTPFISQEGNLFLTISCAAATYNPKEALLASPPNLLMKLDAALKEAETKAKNHIIVVPLR